MGMTDKQFNGFIRFILDDNKEVIETMEDGKGKEICNSMSGSYQRLLSAFEQIGKCRDKEE